MPKKKISGIYMIRNTLNDKKYIGLSRDCAGRISRHKINLRRNKHSNCHLQAAWNMYGEDAFEFSIIEECAIESLPSREVYWINHFDSFKNGYNRSGGGDGTTDVVLSEERNRLISESLTGRTRKDVAGGKNHKARRVVCLNNGERFACLRDATNKYYLHYEGAILSCTKGCTVGDNTLYMFMYEEEYDSSSAEDIYKRVFEAISSRLFPKGERVVCLNTGVTYNNASDAAFSYGMTTINSIHKCCKGTVPSCGQTEKYEPLAWMYEKDYLSASSEEIQQRINDAKNFSIKRYKVVCVETRERFDNATQAAKRFGISNVTLSEKLRTTGELHRVLPDGKSITLRIA